MNDITNEEINYIKNQINKLNEIKIGRNRFIFIKHNLFDGKII